MISPHQVQVGLAFCTPIPYTPGRAGPRLAPITTQWHRARMALVTPTNFNVIQIIVDGLEVGHARNEAVRGVLQHDPMPEFLFFLDYDVIPSCDAIQKLHLRARHFPEHDIFAGVYCSKSDLPEPLIYKGNGVGPFWDWTIGDLLTEEITGVHMGLTLIRSSLLKRMAAADVGPLFLTVDERIIDEKGLHTKRGTEDLYFCDRAVNEFGARILVDTSVLAGHIDNGSGRIYGLPRDTKPVMGARWVEPNDEYREERKALDLGAGKERRHWEGYRTYTTDIRPDSGADYVMDTRGLNLPDNHFDLVASSHHLEHIPRWEQEAVWKEIYRITKPGGRIEHIIPNVAWAAARIFDGEMDVHIQNVLYGAQEAHGYAREFNLHYFGYTPEVAKALAEEAGFVEVSVETWKDRPELSYEMIVCGKKSVTGSEIP